MKTNMTVARTRRILARLDSYRLATADDCDRLGLVGILDSSEQLIGVYVNPPGSDIAEIGVTTDRLHLHTPGKTSESVKYRDIKAITLGEAEKASQMIIVTRYDGSVCKVEVAGGEGKFRDSMSFLQFLDRVVGDLRRSPGATG